jgi:D-lactate dehydrogenase
MVPSVAFFDTKNYDRDAFERANQDYRFPITYYAGHLTRETVSLTREFQAVCVFVNDFLTEEIIRHLYKNGIKLIALRSAGYNNVDLKAVYRKVHVVRVPAYSPHAVAEHAVALMLTLNRKIHRAYYRIRDNNFSIDGFLGFDMRGKTAGIVGTGKIGQAAIQILHGFGMRILAYDPYPQEAFASSHGVEYVDQDYLFANSDIISLHCPLAPENVHLINRKTIDRMKKNVMIINTGRGKLINTADLIEALKQGKIGSAGLDVYEEEEQYFFEDFSTSIISDDILARLLTFPNVLITSHQGFFTREALDNIAKITLENIRLYFQENRLPNEVCYKCEQQPCRKKETGRCF